MSVGLDIGTKTIKIVELSKEGNAFSLKASGIVGYAGKSVEQLADEKEYAELSQVILNLAKEAKVASKDVILALPEPKVFTMTITFPSLTDQEIASAIKWEAEQYIPIPVQDAIIQHQIIERNEKTSPPKATVLLVAAPRALVEKYIKVVQMAKLNPVAVETELMALSRSIGIPNQTTLLLDLGASSTDIAITKGTTLIFSRSIPTAGEALTRAVAQGLGVEPMQAEEYKKTYGFTQGQLEGKIKAALDPVFRVIVDEVKKAIHHFQTEQKGEAPKLAIVTGGTAGLPNMMSSLSSLLGMEVSIGNPFSKVAVSAETSKVIAPYSPLYAVSVGLAMQ